MIYLFQKQNQNNQPQINIPQGVNFKEISLIDTLDMGEKRKFEIFRNNCCHCCCCSCGPQGIKGKMNYFLSMSIVSLIFSIASIITSLNFCPEYTEMRNMLLLKLEEEGNLLNKKKSDIKSFWCDLKKEQNCVLFIIFAFLVLFLIFEIIQKRFYNTITEEEKQQGKITKLMILFNYIFKFIFIILAIISFLFFIYELIFILTPPLEFERNSSDIYLSYLDPEYKYVKSEEEILFEKLLKKCLIFGIVNSIILLLIFSFMVSLCFIDELIYLYLDLNFEKSRNLISTNNNTNNNQNQNYINTINIVNSTNNLNKGNAITINNFNINSEIITDDKIKRTSLFLEGKNIDIQIKADKNLYLQEINTNSVETFKQVLLENITNDFIYIRLKNESIKNMLSITDWEYPKLDQLYIFLNNSYIFTFVALFFFIPSLFFQTNDYHIYFQIKDDLSKGVYSDIPYINIFNYYGNFQKGVAESRFYLYLIAIIILYIFIIKRAIYRSLNNSNFILIAYFLSILFMLLNAIYIILNIILIVFSILSLITEEKYSDKYNENYNIKPNDDMLSIVFWIEIIINFFFLGDFCKLYRVSVALLSYVSMIKNKAPDLDKKKSTQEVELNEIQYFGLDLNLHTLYEYQIEGYPRYLYYSLKNQNLINNKKLIENDKNNGNMDIMNSKNELIIQQQKNNIETISLKNKENNF